MEKRLYRSRENRMLFGVCGGIGEYTNLDPTVIRLGMVFLGLTFVGILFYIAAGLIIPEAPLNGRRGQAQGAGYGGDSRNRGADDAFDPVASAKPDLKPEAMAPIKTEEAPAVQPETKFDSQTKEAL